MTSYQHGRRNGPTVSPPRPRGLSPVLARNIAALDERRRREHDRAKLADRVSDAITGFAGSMAFVLVHAVVAAFWVAANVGWIPGLPRWDESFVILGTGASVEAIFLSTFVLISQNRMAATAARRADLDLQISLLAEHEITKLVTLSAAIAARLGVTSDADTEIPELERDVAPETVLDELERHDSKAGATSLA